MPFFNKYITPALFPTILMLSGVIIGSYLLLQILNYKVSQVEAEQQNFVRKDTQLEVDKRIEDKIDLLLGHFKLVYTDK